MGRSRGPRTAPAPGVGRLRVVLAPGRSLRRSRARDDLARTVPGWLRVAMLGGPGRRLAAVLPWVGWAATRLGWALVIAHDVSVAHQGQRWLSEPVDGDVRLHYYGLTSRMMHGAVPYKDFQYEYPPLTLPLLAAAWSVGGGHPRRFLAAWMLLMLLLDAGVTLLLSRWSPSTGAVWLWVAGVALIGPEMLTRNDLLAAAAFVAGCYAVFRAAAPVASGLAFGAGVWAKVWPAVPLLNVVSADRRRSRIALGAFAATVVVFAPLLWFGASRAMLDSLVGYHGRRPLEIESVYAGVAMLLDHFRGALPHVQHSFGSFNVVSPRLRAVALWAGRVTIAWQVATVGLGLLARGSWPHRRAQLAWLWVLFVAVSLCVTPVFSAQYAVWLLATVCVVVACVPGRPATVAAALTLAVCVATQVLYPWLFTPLRLGQLAPVVMVNVRTAVVVALAALAAASWWRVTRSADVGA